MKFNEMGVINITPNSFSDGVENFDSLLFKKKFEEVSSWAKFIDLGAESTAPMNDAISSESELSRYEKIVFPVLPDLSDPKKIISIDTYKHDVYKEVAKVLKKYFKDSSFIWNDVSGKIDDSVMAHLKDTRDGYIFCHNLSKKRDESIKHMKNTLDVPLDEFYALFEGYFRNSLNGLESFKERIIIDPTFGFSKTREQNYYLIENFKKFYEAFTGYKFLIGISRKSFLRPPDMQNSKGDKNHAYLDALHKNIIERYFSSMKEDLIFRTHAPIDS